MKDDEVLREEGMTDGPKKIGNITLRPITALSLSWMQRNEIFSDSVGDMLQKTAAFAFLHSEDKTKIRSVVNDRVAFINAVDDWIDANIPHHKNLEPISEIMNQALESYMAAISVPVYPSNESTSSKN